MRLTNFKKNMIKQDILKDNSIRNLIQLGIAL